MPLILPYYHGDEAPRTRFVYPEVDWNDPEPIKLGDPDELRDAVLVFRMGYPDSFVDCEPRRTLVKAWWTRYGTSPVAAKSILTICETEGLFGELLDLFDSEKRKSTKMGSLLAKERDRIYAGYQIKRHRTAAGHSEYSLVPVGGQADEALPTIEGKLAVVN